MKRLLPISVLVFVIALPLFAFVPQDTDFPEIGLEAEKMVRAGNIPEFLAGGGGNWQIFIDPKTGILRRARGGYIETGITSDHQERVLSFLLNNSDALGLGKATLSPYKEVHFENKYILTYREEIHHIPVYDGYITVMITETGRLYSITSHIKTVEEVPTVPAIGQEEVKASVEGYLGREVAIDSEIRQVILKKSGRTHLAFDFVVSFDGVRAEALVDAKTGELLALFSLCRFDTFSGSFDGEVYPYNALDEIAIAPLPYIEVWLGSSGIYADEAGSFEFSSVSGSSFSLQAHLKGIYADVDNASGEDGAYHSSVTLADSPYSAHFTRAYAEIDEINAYYHTNFIHQYVKYFLGYNAMDYQMPVTVLIENYDNAYWDGRGVNFGDGGATMYSFALFAEIIYHEYTHGVTHHIYPDYQLPYSGEPGAIDEALSDYFACSLTDDPRVADGIYLYYPGMFRTIDNHLCYPDDMSGEAHADGRIIGGAFWDTRELIGQPRCDSLVHLARFDGYPNEFEEFLYAMLDVDDNDGYIGNGTPNAVGIYTGFYNHTIGPGIRFELIHTPLMNTMDTVHSYRVVVDAEHTFDVASGGIVLHYRIDGGSWTDVTCVGGGFTGYSGFIPAQPLETRIDYYITGSDLFGLSDTLPDGAPDSFFTFFVQPDADPPIVEFTPLLEQSPIYWPRKIYLKALDNTGISSASVEFYRDGRLIDHLEMVHTDDEERYEVYEGTMNFPIEVGDTILYRIIVVDSSPALNSTILPEEGFYNFPITERYIEDFDHGRTEYRHYTITGGYGDNWHICDYRSYPDGEYSWKCGSVSEGGNYDDLLDCALETPLLTIGETATLQFYSYILTEMVRDDPTHTWDGGIVELSTDMGISWEQIFPTDGYPLQIEPNEASPFDPHTPCFGGTSPGWGYETFLVTGHPGDVKFRFRFGSDAHVTDEGWYIDCITVQSRLAGVDEKITLPEEASIHAYPNPFNTKTSIQLFVPRSGMVTVSVYNIRGEIVATILDNFLPAGTYRTVWDASSLPSGVYLTKLKASGRAATTKLLLLK